VSSACHDLSAAAHRSVETPPTQNHIIILHQRWKFQKNPGCFQNSSHLAALYFSAGQNLQKMPHNSSKAFSPRDHSDRMIFLDSKKPFIFYRGHVNSSF